MSETKMEMLFLHELEQHIYEGYLPTKEDALRLANVEIRSLKESACRIRQYYSQNGLRFLHVLVYPFSVPIPLDVIREKAESVKNHGAELMDLDLRRFPVTQAYLDDFCETVAWIRKNTGLSLGLAHVDLTKDQFHQVQKAGICRYHDFLGTPKARFSEIFHQHFAGRKFVPKASWNRLYTSLLAAKSTGLEIASGVFVGVGETMEERIDLILAVRELGVSYFLFRSPNTFEEFPSQSSVLPMTELARTIAISRFLLVKKQITLCIHSEYYEDGHGLLDCGANGMLKGITAEPFSVTLSGETDIGYEMGFIII